MRKLPDEAVEIIQKTRVLAGSLDSNPISDKLSSAILYLIVVAIYPDLDGVPFLITDDGCVIPAAGEIVPISQVQ